MSPRLFNTLLLIASGAMYYLLIGPLYSGQDTGIWAPSNSIKTLIADKARYTQTLDGVDKIIKKAKDMEKDYQAIDDETKRKLAVMVPQKVEDLQFYAELERIASAAGTPLLNVSVKDKGGSYTVTFAVDTTYSKFKQFITYYEKSMRLFSLDSVAFSPTPEENTETKFNVVLTTYYVGAPRLK